MSKEPECYGPDLIFPKISQALQIDKPLLFALAARVWQAASGPITIALIIWSLSPDEQGIYYGIVPVIGIQALLELGLLNVLISQAGHAWAACCQAEQRNDDRQLVLACQRMRGLIVSSRRWFAAAALLFIAIALTVGWYSFSQTSVSVDWRLPLLVVVPLAAVAVYFSPGLAILEGAGRRELIYRFRLYQMACGTIAVWLALVGGIGVWALVVATAVQAAWTMYLVVIDQAPFFNRFLRLDAAGPDNLAGGDPAFSWVRDVLPKQWRVAVTGAAFHLATQFLALIVLTFHSAAEAGRLGMTLSITTAIQMLALAWVQTKYPLISEMHGTGGREQAGTLWRRTALVSCGLLVLAFAVLTGLIASLPWFSWGWEDRFIAPWQVLVLGIGCLANHAVAIQACYVLARNANPLTAASLTGYLGTAIAVWVAGYYASTTGVVIAFTAGITLLALPLHTLAYLHQKGVRYRFG